MLYSKGLFSLPLLARRNPKKENRPIHLPSTHCLEEEEFRALR